MKDKKDMLKELERQMLSGYASLDKPSLKHYPVNEEMLNDIPEEKMYDYLRHSSEGHPSITALNYYGNLISYSNLLKKIDEVASAYSKLGIKSGDRVSFCVPTLPESIYSLYALNMIGATACFIDPRTGAERIKKCINKTNSNVLVTIDLACPKIDKIVDSTTLDKVVVVGASDSLPFGLSMIYNGKMAIKKFLGKISNDSGYMKWRNFVDSGKGALYNEAKYTKDKEAAIIYTSGTTRDPKGVIITDYALNALAHQYKISGVKYYDGVHFLNVMPTFLLYGLACGIHMPLSLGMTDIIIPQVNRKDFPKLVLQHKPGYFMVNPDLFDSLIESDKMKNKDLSWIISAGIGGSGITIEEETKYNEFLRSHNSYRALGKGYGATEGGSAFVATTHTSTDKLGSAGVALPHNTVSIFAYDVDENGKVIRTTKELKYGELGEICITGPTLMKGYLENPELTNEVLRVHPDGLKWLHTGDYGRIDSNGNVFVGGRIDRMIIRPDSHCVYLAAIENVIARHKAIKSVAVVGITPKDIERGKLPKAVITLKEQYKQNAAQIIKELIDMCNNELPERDVAYYYEVLEELPMSLSGKVDYKKLEQEQIGDFYDANIKISDLISQKVMKLGSK